MAISSAVKIVIPSVSRAEYSILSSGMQNAAAVLPSNFLKHSNKYVYPLYTRYSLSSHRNYSFRTMFLLPAFETEMSTEHSFRRQGGDGGRRELSQFMVWCSLTKPHTLL